MASKIALAIIFDDEITGREGKGRARICGARDMAFESRVACGCNSSVERASQIMISSKQDEQLSAILMLELYLHG